MYKTLERIKIKMTKKGKHKQKKTNTKKDRYGGKLRVCMYVWPSHKVQSMDQPDKVANLARGQLNREN